MNNTFMDRVNEIVAKNQNASVADDNQNSVSNVPRYANLMNQPHMLAYINPQEEQMLRDSGGAGAPGPDGIPVYGWWSDTWSEITSGGQANTETYNSPSNNTSSPVVNTQTPVNTNSNSVSVGAVSPGGQYAGDGFEWKKNPGGYLTRTYTGVNQNLTGSYDAPTGFNNPNVQQFASDSPSAPEPEPEVTDSSSFLTGGGSDGVGKYGAVGDFWGSVGDALGLTNYGSQAARNTGSPYQRTFTQAQLDALDTENTMRESFANLLTPFDNAEYIGGNLVTEIEPGVFQDLTGGGVIRNKAGALDRIYGVSDDFSNNAPIEQGNMSNQDYAIALARQKMLEDKPPSDAAYFSSFIPGAILPPPLGGYLGQQMVEPGVKARQAEIDRHIAALQEGGKPEGLEDGNYTGYKTSEGSFVPFNTDKPDPMVTDSYGALNIGPPPDDNPPAEVVYRDQQLRQAAQSVFNRYYKGGSGLALPYWLRRYASGQVVDMDLKRVTKDGVEYYQDENNMLIPVSELPNLKIVEN